MYSIILCGGSGTRLWPLSRKNYPKQFLKLYSDKSLLQETFLRIAKAIPKENIVFITNSETFFNVYNQIKEVYPKFSKAQILSESSNRNTAPAIAYAMKYLHEEMKALENDPIIILPSDHYIGKEKEYLKVVKRSIKEVGDNIGTIGIAPTSPETGYGYIKKGDKKGKYFLADEFREKPDEKTAKKYLKSGQYVWNSGKYVFNYKTFKEELEKYSPKIFNSFNKDMEDFLNDFSKLPSISIDYAISEKSDKVVVFEGDFGWDDIGSFDSLAEVLSGKVDKNPKHVKMNSKNVFIHSRTNKLIATMDVEDLIIVENNDSILIQKKGKSENVKKVVEFLKKNNRKELNDNIILHRPWGRYEVLINGSRHRVRKMTIYPGEHLSLQMHRHRAEHWVIIKGKAQVTSGKKKVSLGANESIFIPKSTKHQLGNPGKVDLEIIEVQTGKDLRDNDTVIF